MRRGKLSEINDSGDQQLVTLFGPRGETLKNVPVAGRFGVHSIPPLDSHGLIAQLGGGDAARRLIAALGLEHAPSRPKNRESGSSMLYDVNGNKVSLTKDALEIEHASKIVLKVGGVTVTVTSGGVTYAGGTITHDGKVIDATHRHRDVQPGSGVSGVPS